MANYIIGRARVRDYSEWKTGYDADETGRAAAGLIEKHVLQEADDPNMVTLIFEAEDLKRAAEFLNSDDVREVMQRAGVVGKPEIYFLKG